MTKVFSWNLDKVIDAHNVYWTVSYHKGQSGGYMRPWQIAYSQGAGLACVVDPLTRLPVNPAVCRTVDFNYLVRTIDAPTSHTTGAEIVADRLLSRIVVKLGGQPVRSYALEYLLTDSATARRIAPAHRLTSVTETGADGITALPATKFTYHTDSNGASLALGPTSMTGAIPTEPLKDDEGPGSCTHLLDINGDGLVDVFVGSPGNYSYYPNLGKGVLAAKVAIPSAGFPSLCNYVSDRIHLVTGINSTGIQISIGNNLLLRAPIAAANARIAHRLSSVIFAVPGMTSSDNDTAMVDIDGDGLVDLVDGAVAGTNTWGWRKNRGDGTFATRATLYGSYTEVLGYYWERAQRDRNDAGRPWPFAEYRFVDMDGDGLVDLVWMVNILNTTTSVWTMTIQWWKNIGNGSFESVATTIRSVATSTVIPWVSSADVSKNRLNFVDMNGDGLPDLAWLAFASSTSTPGLYMVYRPNLGGKGFGNPVIMTNKISGIGTHSPAYFTDHNFTIVDMNGDGFPDLLVGKGNAYIFFPNRNGLHLDDLVYLQGSPAINFGRYRHDRALDDPRITLSSNMSLADIDGDGYIDIVQGNAGNYRYYSLNASSNHSFLETATNPLGGGLRFDYELKRSNNTIRWVPSMSTQSDGLGGVSQTTYSFVGGKSAGWPHNEFRGYESVYEHKGATVDAKAFKLVNFHQPVAVLAPSAGRTHRAYLWAYRSGPLHTAPAVVFDFQMSRAGKHTQQFLQGYQGALMVVSA